MVKMRNKSGGSSFLHIITSPPKLPSSFAHEEDEAERDYEELPEVLTN
jgi:hypothetical protein